MPTARQELTLAAAPERVWELIADPCQMPRWWPGVTRVEAVDADRWTQVFATKHGRSLRVDFRLVESEQLSLRAWEQEIPGTPFENVLRESVTELRLEAVPSGTRVALTQRQKLRGYSRTGGPLLARATRRRLRMALDGLARIC